MKKWLNLVSCFLVVVALRLHSDTITPLQLIFKISDSRYHQDKIGAILMDSLDALKCFEDIAHLITIRTLKFRHFFKKTCSKRFDLGLAKRYGKYAVQRNLALAEMLGMDCVSKIEGFGRIFPARPLYGISINSWTNVDSFSKKQVKAMLNSIEHSRDKDDLLFSGFLSFGRVEDEGIIHELFKRSRNIFDGPFCEYNNRYCLSIVPLFLGIAVDDDHFITASSFDINEIPEDEYRFLKARLAEPITAIDFIARFMQLTAAHIYTSFSTRIALSVPSPRLIHDVTMWLAEFTLMHSRYFDTWIVEVRAAVNLAKSILQMDIFATDFKKDIAKAGYLEEHQFFDLINDMAEQILNDEEISQELVDTITRLKIEILVVISQFEVSAEIMNSHVKGTLKQRKIRGYMQKPRCRHLVVLLWALSKEDKVHRETCRLLMEFILENMSPDSDYFEVFRRLGLLKFLPISYKQREARKTITNQFGSQLVDEVIGLHHDSESNYLTKLPFINHHTVNFRAKNGYLDINLIRHVLRGHIVSMIRHYMVYCGHHDGRPVYIQSLACHVSVSSLFQLLLMFACVLRIKLPFALHPHLMRLIAKPDNREITADYLHTAVQHELNELPRHAVDKKVPQILMQIEQTKYLLSNPDDSVRTQTDYENWVHRLYSYRRNDRSIAEQKMIQLHAGLVAYGTALVSHTVMKTSFTSMYEQPGVSHKEGFAILLNHTPELNRIES